MGIEDLEKGLTSLDDAKVTSIFPAMEKAESQSEEDYTAMIAAQEAAGIKREYTIQDNIPVPDAEAPTQIKPPEK